MQCNNTGPSESILIHCDSSYFVDVLRSYRTQSVYGPAVAAIVSLAIIISKATTCKWVPTNTLQVEGADKNKIRIYIPNNITR